MWPGWGMQEEAGSPNSWSTPAQEKQKAVGSTRRVRALNPALFLGAGVGLTSVADRGTKLTDVQVA